MKKFLEFALRQCLAAALCVAGGGAVAQSAYPSRPVRLVVPFPAGAGTNDMLARLIAQKLGERLGQPFVVDHRPGASGIIGNDIVAKAPPDGYTIPYGQKIRIC